ncbi:MAG: transketolase [Thermomicrobiales bacterium]
MVQTSIDPVLIRTQVIRQSYRAGVGHIGPALSIADIIAALYGNVLSILDPSDPDRDRFILGKGHAALALYAALHLRGWISRDELATYCEDGTRLGVHPEHCLPGIDLSTGSLGQGLPVAVGMALAARMQQSPRRVFALLSDAECNEGSVWEAVMFAAHHKLSNLAAIVDLNGLQALAPTSAVLDLAPLASRWSAFGWETREVDGHDIEALTAALAKNREGSHRPLAVIARTNGGKGISYMENQVDWHYLPMNETQYREALAELGARP